MCGGERKRKEERRERWGGVKRDEGKVGVEIRGEKNKSKEIRRNERWKGKRWEAMKRWGHERWGQDRRGEEWRDGAEKKGKEGWKRDGREAWEMLTYTHWIKPSHSLKGLSRQPAGLGSEPTPTSCWNCFKSISQTKKNKCNNFFVCLHTHSTEIAHRSQLAHLDAKGACVLYSVETADQDLHGCTSSQKIDVLGLQSLLNCLSRHGEMAFSHSLRYLGDSSYIFQSIDCQVPVIHKTGYDAVMTKVIGHQGTCHRL